jgi:hypothetical protein
MTSCTSERPVTIIIENADRDQIPIVPSSDPPVIVDGVLILEESGGRIKVPERLLSGGFPISEIKTKSGTTVPGCETGQSARCYAGMGARIESMAGGAQHKVHFFSFGTN